MDISNLNITSTPKGVSAISFVKKSSSSGSDSKKVKTQLDEYFSGTRTKFDVELDPLGTPFQIKVWQALQAVPYGETATYQDIANKIGRSKAVRAVANAIGANPIAIIIPCHRIIRSDGSLGGYRWGSEIKTAIQQLEKMNFLA
ncbi:MAG: methylated-DNA--[protein]-cysteine S-methyltransferase [Patescibacteria group bacterium]|nr:methylated-DNA--[protein]-cysteine S-methyltransferase [Patescibacteria group bacterium]